MDETMIVSRTLILIDPSSPHGEGGLDVLTNQDRAVTVLFTLDGRSAASLRDFAIGGEWPGEVVAGLPGAGGGRSARCAGRALPHPS